MENKKKALKLDLKRYIHLVREFQNFSLNLQAFDVDKFDNELDFLHDVFKQFLEVKEDE